MTIEDFIRQGTDDFIQAHHVRQMRVTVETSGKTMPSAELQELMRQMTEKLKAVDPAVYWQAQPCDVCQGHNPERPIHYEIAWKTSW